MGKPLLADRKCSYCKERRPRDQFRVLECGALGVVCEPCRTASAKRKDDRRLAAVGNTHASRKRYWKKRDGVPKVYFLQVDGGGPIKIGYTIKSPSLRRKECATGCPYPLAIVGVMLVDGPDDERLLHERFQASRLRAEWFRPTPQLVQFIADNASKGEAPPQHEPAAAEWIERFRRGNPLATCKQARAEARCSGLRFNDGKFGEAWRNSARPGQLVLM